MIVWTGLSVLAAIILFGVIAFFYLRSDKFNRYVVTEIDTALREYGLRAEIEGFNLGSRWRTINLRGLKLYNLQTGQLVATLDSAVVRIEIREPYALRLRREVVFHRLEVEGLKLFVERDEQGRSNFDGVHLPPPRAPSRITFDTSGLVASLAKGSVSVKDRRDDIHAELGGLQAEVRPELDHLNVQFTSGAGSLRRYQQTTAVEGFTLKGRLTSSNAEIESLSLKSSAAEGNFSGRIDDFKALRYQFDGQANLDLDEVVALAAPDLDLSGRAGFNGHIEGEGLRFRVSGKLNAEELSASDIAVRNAQVEGVTVERPDAQKDELKFAASQVRAQALATKGVRLTGATVAALSGTFYDGRTQLTARQAHANRVDAREVNASNVTLQNITAAVADGRTQLTARQANVNRVDAREGRASDITLQNVTAAVGKNESTVRGDLRVGNAASQQIAISNVSGKLTADQKEVSLADFTASVFGGSAKGNLTLKTVGNAASRLQAEFAGVNVGDVFSVVSDERTPLVGTVAGKADISWPGFNTKLLSGDINASIVGQTTSTSNVIPVTGDVIAKAERGVFNLDRVALRTGASEVTASGSLALSGDSNLRLSVKSTRAEELQTIVASLDVAKEAFEKYKPQVKGDFSFTGTLTGPLSDPTVAGDVSVTSIGLGEELLGSLTTKLAISPAELRIEDALLTATNGGTVRANYVAPRATIATEGKLDATFERIDVAAAGRAGGFTLGEKLLTGEVTGEAHLINLPASPQGTVNISLINGTVVGQPAETSTANVVFDQGIAKVERVEIKLPQGLLTANGTFALESKEFQFEGQAQQVSLARLPEALEQPNLRLGGVADATFKVSGDVDDIEDLKVELNAQGKQVSVNHRDAGELTLTARTSPGGRIDIELTTNITGKPQPLTASIELRQPGRPIDIRTDLNNFDLAPVLAIVAPNAVSSVAGVVTGALRVSGPLFNEKNEASADNLRGNLTLTAITLQVTGTKVTVATPFVASLNDSRLTIEPTRVTARGTDLNLGGTLALSGGKALDFALTGTLDLNAFLPPDSTLIAGGSAAIDVRAGGTLDDPQLGGEVRLSNLELSTLDSPVRLEEGSGRIVLAGNRITIESLTARAGDGEVRVDGGVTLAQFQPSEWRFNASVNNVDIFYSGIRAVANGNLVLAGTPQSQTLSGTITIPLAEYTAPFTLDEFSGGGSPFALGGIGTTGGSDTGFLGLPPIGLNVRVDASESILIRNEQVNTTASAAIRVGGTLGEPDISGRITLEGGTVSFRGERYDLTAGTLDLPGGFGADPYVNLLAEGDVNSYRVYVGITGEIDELDVSLRSEPELARAEILSLITTGSVETGTLNSDDIVRSGLGTAASLLSQEFISNPVGREAERFLGLNRFQIDPVLRPNENPAAQLTIGSQLARGLTFAYSTNLAAQQDQTAIVEYSLTSRFSAIVSYAQGGSSARQGSNDNNFTIEIRGRKRFSLGAGGIDSTTAKPTLGTTMPPRPPLPSATVDLNKPEAIKIKDRRLRELLPVMREGFSRALTRLGERNLTNYLQEEGYFFAQVHSHCEPVSCTGPDLRVIYDAVPGERYSLSDIRLEGAKEINKGNISGLLQSQESKPLAAIPLVKRLPFVGGYARGITSNDRLRNDREAIRNYLIDQGFRSARVTSRLAVTPENEKLIVIFGVEEGPRSTIADVAMRGNLVFDSTELRREVPVKDGDAFSPSRLREGAQRITSFYTRLGYLDAKTNLTVTDLPDNQVRLTYEVNEGVQAFANEIAISGFTITREEAIRRFLTFKTGDLLTPQLLRGAQRELYATGAFREVNVRAEPISGGDESARRVTVNVTEAKPLLLVYGLGYSTDDGPRGLLQLTHTNLFGRMLSGTMKLRTSRREQLAQLQFTDLRPFNHNWPTTFSVFYNRNADLLPFARRLVDTSQNNNRAGRTFGINRFSTYIQTERKLGDLTSLRFRYSFENAKLFNLENIPQLEVTRNEQATRLGQFSAGISHDTRDSILNPSRGQLLSVDHTLAARIFGGNEAFNKFFSTYQRYSTLSDSFPLLGNTVTAFSARVGLAKAFRIVDRNGDGMITEPERRLPISERFFAGGATTLRGFRFEEAGPQGVLEPRNANELPTLVPLGGDALMVFNFELRYPLTQRLRLVPFYDLGNVFRSVRDISWGGMTNTLGFGLRINTPIGPVGFDYGYLLDPPAFTTASGGILRQPRTVFHIRIGQTF
jgi:outer membrane protein assembly complex protein YaeT